MDYGYANGLQRLRADNRITQERLAGILGKSVDSVKAYERGTRSPPPEVLLQLAQKLKASEFLTRYINQDPIISRILPPLKVNQTLSETVLRFMNSFRQFGQNSDELYGAADSGLSDETISNLSAMISDGLALRVSEGIKKDRFDNANIEPAKNKGNANKIIY